MTDQDPEGTLSYLRQLLEQWARAVPAGAVRFHDRCRGMSARVSAEQARKWPFGPRAEEISKLMTEVRALEPVVQGLAGALRRMEEVSASIEQARGIVSRLEDRTLLQWFDQWRGNWQYQMQSVGRAVYREQDLHIDFQTLQGVEWQVSEIRSSMQIYFEAHQLLGQFSAEIQAVSLRADLSAHRESLFREPPDLVWRDAVARAMAPLLAIANQPPPQPPSDLSAAYRLATEAERWAEALGVDGAATQELLRNIGIAQGDSAQWGDDSVRALVAQASELAGRLRDESRRRRAAEEESYRTDLAAVREACGAMPAVEETFREIERIAAEDPYHHRQWKSASQEARRALLDELGVRRADARKWADAQRAGLLARLDDLAARPLPEAHVAARAVTRREVASAESFPVDADPILQRLHAIVRWTAQVARLEQHAHAAGNTIESRRRAVAARHAELAEYEKSLALAPPDLDGPLEALRAPSGPAEPILERLSMIEKQLDHRGAAVVRECQARVKEDVELCRTATALVQTLLSGVTQDVPPVCGGEVTPAAAMKVREGSRRQREQALGRVVEGVERFTKRIPGFRARLEEAMSRPDITEEHRTWAEEVLDVAAAAGWKALDPIEGFKQLKVLVSRAEVLLHELSAREDEVARLRSELDRMFATSSEEGLTNYLRGPLEQRVRWLRRGVPEKPRHLGAAIHQLEAAHTLSARLLDHARRVAAHKFVESLAAVEAETARSSSFAARAEQILREVRALPLADFPPADVRERVILLATSLRTGGHRA